MQNTEEQCAEACLKEH